MARSVFWSWQSDLDQRVTRSLIRDALASAIEAVAADLEEAERPSLTHDTKDVAGTPDIFATILAKIDAASVFVADVTPVGMTDDGKPLANPNVLIELGYAKKSIGPLGIVLVWNTSFQGASPEQLPFDLRGRRAPLGYSLEPGADRQALAVARAELSKNLVSRIKACLDAAPSRTSPVVPWLPTEEEWLGAWFPAGAILTVTNPEFGSTRIRLRQSDGRGYARLLPDKWNPAPDALAKLQSPTGTPALVGGTRGLGWGSSRGGMAVYRPNNTDEQPMDVGAITQWFSSTGEFWGVANEFFYADNGGLRNLATTYLIKHWSYFLSRNGYLAQSVGGGYPLHVRLGVTNLDNSWWPVESIFPDEGRFSAVEDRFEFLGTLESYDETEIFRTVADAFNSLAAVYGRRPWSVEKIAEVAAGTR